MEMQAKENYHHSLFDCISFCTFIASRVNDNKDYKSIRPQARKGQIFCAVV